MSCGDRKWACGLCTYLNYSGSSRCTMCANVRPQDHIIIPTGNSGRGVASRVVAPSSPPPVTGDKWPCSQCTYLNYPRSTRCSQCYTQRASDVATSPDHTTASVAAPVSPTSPVHSIRACQSPTDGNRSNTSNTTHHSPPSSKTSHSPTHKSRQSPPLKSRQSPPLKSRQSPPLKSRQSPPLKFHHQSSPKGRRSPPRQCSRSTRVAVNNRVNHETQTSPPGGDALPLDQHQHLLAQHKWCCPACTYENWPRSVRCIMCATPKKHQQASVDRGSEGNSAAAGGGAGGGGGSDSKSTPSPTLAGDTANENRTNSSSALALSSSGSLNRKDGANIELGNSCSKSIEISELVASDVNTRASTNTSDMRTDKKDSQNRFIVGDESKTCETINIINRNRSEVGLSHESPSPSISLSSSKSFSVSSVVTSAAAVLSSSDCITSTATSTPIISCPAVINNTPAVVHSSTITTSCPSFGATVSPSPPNNTSTSTSSCGGAISQQQASNNRDSLSGSPVGGGGGGGDTDVRGRGEGAMALNNYETERLLRQLRRRLREADLAFLNACLAVVEGNYAPVELYLSSGGDPMRQLTSTDVKLLARPSAFDEGHTLVHLAIRFGREDLLDTILSGIDGGGCGVKRVPCYVAPELATDIRRGIAASLRQRRDAFPCYCVQEFVTYSLPPEVETLGSSSAQDRLWEELLDRDAQKQLEEDAPIINWSLELTDRLGSRLYALWNRTAGDCLLDSVLQATWGVFDRDNCLRRALAASITEAAHLLYPRWKEYERLQARMLDYAVPENQVMEEWAELVCLASQPGAALDQLHILVLAHILRRPIIVYGVKCVKSFRGEDLGYARFEGVYLPLLWDSSFCCKSPIALGYTRGHFCALVPICPQSINAPAAGAILEPGESQLVFLPLMSHDAKLLPVHFITQAEVGCEAALLREWLDVCQSETGLLVAQQKLHKKPLPVAQMTEEWLNYYRTMAQMEGAPFSRPITSQGYSSDGDSEEE